MKECLLLGDAFQLRAALPQAVGTEAILDLNNVELPASPLRITSWIGDGPPRHILRVPAMLGEDSPQITERVEIAEFAEKPRHCRPPARREEIQKIAHELDIAIEMIIVVL